MLEGMIADEGNGFWEIDGAKTTGSESVGFDSKKARIDAKISKREASIESVFSDA